MFDTRRKMSNQTLCVCIIYSCFFCFFSLSRICVFNHVKLWLFGTYWAYRWRAEKSCRSGFKSFCCFDTFQNLSLFELIIPNMNSNCPRLVCERDNYKLFPGHFHCYRGSAFDSENIELGSICAPLAVVAKRHASCLALNKILLPSTLHLHSWQAAILSNLSG